MSDIVFNDKAKNDRIKAEFDRCKNLIKYNAAAGVDETEMYISRDICSEVRTMLEEHDSNITFKVLDKRCEILRNGSPKWHYIVGERCGDETRFVARYQH